MATQDAYADATKWADGNWGWVPAGENKDELEKLSCGTNSLSIKLDVKTKRYTAFRDTDDPILANILSIWKDNGWDSTTGTMPHINILN